MADRPEGIPTERVNKMRAQGMSNDKIVDTLQRDGYLSSQIFDAMTQADMEPAEEVEEVTDDFPDIMSNVQGEGGQSQDSPPQSPEPAPQGPPQQAPPPRSSQQQGPSPDMSVKDESVEELIESIIDEKWQEIEEDIEKVVTWKNDTEKRMEKLERSIEDLEEKFDKLHQAVIGKVGEYDKNIMNVGAEIKAMEKAFSKIIPEFADSVTELTELVEELKEEKEG